MLKILLNTLILVSFVLISTIKIKAQQVIHDNIITLDQPDQGNKVYMADEKIEFLPGYEFEGSGGDKMKAYISPYGDFFSSTDFNNQELDDNFQVGSLSGIHNVTESGGFAYTIPIDLPKGANGMMPQLSINYNNQSGNGVLGMGWNLQGLSMITRTVKPTYFQDEDIHFNFRGPTSVNTNYEDAFALDGMLLIGVEGDYGYPNSVYATEVENYNRIISHGTQGEGPEWFEVRTKEGMTIKYGLSSQSRINNDDGTALIWLIEYIEDQNGNYIVYTYDETEEEVLISSIKYSGNTNNGINPPTEVKFDYSHRKDPYDYFFDGKRIKNRHIIKSIEVFKEGLELYKYEFSFGFDLYTFLNKVSIKVNDIEEYNPLIFRYGKEEDEIFEPADLILNNQNNTVMVDFNPNYFYHPGATDLTGNGLTDMYQFSTSTGANNLSDPTPESHLHIFKNNGNNDFKKVKELQLPNNLILNGIDSNGEITNNGGHVLMRNTSNINPIDFDGDGKQDLLYFKLQNSIKYDKSEEDYVPLTNRLEKVGYLRSEINNGDYDFNSLESNLLDAGNSGISHLHIWNINQFNFQGDFTGNGVTDILIAGCNISQSTFGITIIPGNPQRANNLTVDNGNSFLLEGADAEFITKSDFVHVIDFNGDGRSDIMAVNGSITKVFTFEISDETDYSSGSGIILDLQAIATELYSSGFPTEWHDFKLGDFNGDGKTDILTINENQNKFTVHYSSGRWFLAEEFELEAQLSDSWRVKDELVPYDFNGDGKTDIIHFTYGVNANRDGFFAHKQIYSSNGNNFSISPRDINFYNKVFGNIVVRLTNYSSSEGFRFTFEDGSTSSPATPNSAINVYTSKLPDTEYVRDNLRMSLASSIGDFSGDGSLDLSVAFNLSVAANSNLEQRTSFTYQDLYSIIELNPYSNFLYLEGVKNGLGITHDIDYTRYNYSIDDIETDDLLNYPLVEFVQRVPVVDNVVIKDHPQNKIAENFYNFKKPVIHQRGKGFLGFTEVNNTDQINELKTSRFYNIFEENTQTSIYDWDQNHFSLYLKKTEVYSESTEELVLKSEYNYEFENLSDKRRLQFLQGVISENLISETVESEYNVYNHINGNLEFKSSSVNVNEYTKIEEFEYGEFASLLGLDNRIIEHTEVVNRLGENPFEEKTSFDYNIQNGNLVEQKMNVNTPYEITEEYNHDAFGNVVKTTVRTSGHEDRVSETIYDSKGRLPIEIINEMDQKITVQYHPKFDKPITIIDVDGLVTTAIYDDLGNLAQKVGKDGIVTEIEKSWFNIDPPTTNNNPVSADDVMWYTKVTTSGKPTRWVYFNRLGQKRMKVVQGKDAPIANIMTFDNKGNMVAETDPFLVGSSNINYLEINYDEYNRVKNVTENNQVVSYTYEVESGLQKTIITNPDGTTNAIYKDAMDNLIKSEDDGGLSEYSYYSHGGLKEVKLNNEVVATSNYDVLGRQNELIDVNAGVITYEYNAFGDITKMTNANNEVKTYVYDEFGRLEQTDNNGNIVNYEYITSGNGINNIEKISTNSHEQTFEYDMLNRMVKTTETIDGESFEFEYILNNLNQLDQIIHPNGFIVNNTYDNNGYLVKVEDENNNLIWEGLSQDAFGRFNTYRKGDGVITELFFDAFGNLEEIDAGSVQHRRYNWDAETGNLTNRKDLINGMEEIFEYDNLNRLKKSTTSIIGSTLAMLPQEVNYLPNGNIKDKTDAGDYAYHPTKPNAVTDVTNDIQNISLLTQDITYNSLNKASTISEGDYTLEFIYGHDKERRKTTFYDLNGLAMEKYFVGLYEKELEGNTTRHINYITAGDGMTAIVVEEEENGNTETETYFTYKDHLGSIVALTDESGDVMFEQSFDPWGRYRNPSNWSYNNITESPTWLRGYTGHEHLPHFELINMNGRIYDPIIGRMLSPDKFIQDPLFSQSYNRYSYVWNNPLKYTDPSGDVVWYAPVIAGAVIGAYTGASIHSSTFNFTKWDSDAWKGAIVGGIVGAGLGYISSASIPSLGVNVTTTSGATAFGVNATATSAMSITSQALLSGNIAIASNYLQGRGIDGAWKGGLIGLGTGALTAGLQIRWPSDDGAIAQAIGGGVYGATDRYIRLREADVQGWELLGYTTLGLFEGFSTGLLVGGAYAPDAYSIYQTALTSSITSWPGLGYSILDYQTFGITHLFGLQKWLKKQTPKYPKEITIPNIILLLLDTELYSKTYGNWYD